MFSILLSFFMLLSSASLHAQESSAEKQKGIDEFNKAVEKEKINPENALIVDFGYDNVRFTAKCGTDYSVFSTNLKLELYGRIAKIIFAQNKWTSKLAKDNNEKKPFTLITLSKDQLNDQLNYVKEELKKIPTCIRNRASSQALVFAIYEQPNSATQINKKYQISQVKDALFSRIGNWDQEQQRQDMMNYAAASLSNVYTFAMADLIALYGVMETLGIQEVNTISLRQ